MREAIDFLVDGRRVSAAPGTTIAAALLDAGVRIFRSSVDGEPRSAVCGMGVCFECRVTIDGIPHRRACLVPVAEGMRVSTRQESVA